jgi:AhpC/TSA family
MKHADKQGTIEIYMKRKWNWPLWIGFIVGVGGLFSYEFFAKFPISRDFPWASLLLFAIGAVLLGAGLVRAFGRPQLYRGKIFGSIFAMIALLLFSLFSYEFFYILRQVPLSAQAPQVGQRAPSFSLPDQDGKQVALADLISPNGVVLIFYRGYW